MVGAASRRTTPSVFSEKPSKIARGPLCLARHSAYSSERASKNKFWPLAIPYAKHQQAPTEALFCAARKQPSTKPTANPEGFATSMLVARVATLRARTRRCGLGTKKAPGRGLGGV